MGFPWRIPYRQRDFPPFLNQRGSHTTPGVRLCFSSDSSKIEIEFLARDDNSDPTKLDVFINNKLISKTELTDDNMTLELDAGNGMNDFLIYLPTDKPIWGNSVRIDNDVDIITTRRPSHPRWLHYGSSITYSVCAGSTQAWPVQVARKLGLNLRDLGFGGNCQSEPMMGRLLRDLPADYITLKLGINSYGGALSARTFAPNLIGLI